MAAVTFDLNGEVWRIVFPQGFRAGATMGEPRIHLTRAVAAREANAGKLSESAKARIDAKANKVLAK